MKAAENIMNIPTEVIRILAGHGRVRVATYAHEGAALVDVAPFEDILHFFVQPDSSTVSALLRSSRMVVTAKAEDGSYQIRMEGRAHAGRPLAGHPAASVLEPWLPEGQSRTRWTVVPFVAEEIEFVRGEGPKSQRNAGLTRAGQERPSSTRLWIRAAFSGMSGALAVFYCTVAAVWFGIQGYDFVGRPWALLLSLMAGLGLLGGVRLLVIAQGFVQWRRLKASRSDAPFLSDGYMSPYEVRLVGGGALFVGVLSLVSVWAVWGPDLSWRVFLVSGVWLCAPAWVLHLAMGRPEPRR